VKRPSSAAPRSPSYPIIHIARGSDGAAECGVHVSRLKPGHTIEEAPQGPDVCATCLTIRGE
jgi:hypothetical protein